jgi:hypothetical protein
MINKRIEDNNEDKCIIRDEVKGDNMKKQNYHDPGVRDPIIKTDRNTVFFC